MTKEAHEFAADRLLAEISNFGRSKEAVDRDIQEVCEAVKHLSDWKRSELNAWRDLPLQEIGKEMNLPLGASISKHILPYIIKLKLDIKGLEHALEEGDSRSDAWKSVYGLCYNLGMSPNSPESGLDGVRRFIQQLYRDGKTARLVRVAFEADGGR